MMFFSFYYIYLFDTNKTVLHGNESGAIKSWNVSISGLLGMVVIIGFSFLYLQ